MSKRRMQNARKRAYRPACSRYAERAVYPARGPKESLQAILSCAESTDEAIVLIKARTDTKYFQALLGSFNDGRVAICFVRGRIKYPGHKSASGMPSAVVYFGQDAVQFKSIFQEVANYIYMPGAFWAHSLP